MRWSVSLGFQGFPGWLQLPQVSPLLTSHHHMDMGHTASSARSTIKMQNVEEDYMGFPLTVNNNLPMSMTSLPTGLQGCKVGVW